MRSPAIPLRSALLVLMLLVFPALPHAACAADTGVSTADGAAIRQVIESQMDAFRRDDGEAAFGFATPALREQFRTAENFMTMVRSGYQPVYRRREVQFGKVEMSDGTPVQHVLVVGPDGRLVEALYFMERQPDGSWRIGGCMLTMAEQQNS